ncbi:MAG: Anti-sigma factor RskA [Edaphobacter sp.]|nr:Anti-sigma factor RskA [Edaphobacter sp.]
MNTHEHYEELCAIAASGQASEDELTDLKSHLDTCASCRGIAYDFTEIGAQGLSVLAAERQRWRIPSGMTQRFIARASSEQIEIKREPASRMPNRNRFAVFAAAGGVAAAALIASFLTFAKPKPFSRLGDHSSAGQASVAASGTNSQPAQVPDARLPLQIASARAELSSFDAKIKAQASELASLRSHEDALNSRLASAEQENSIFRFERTKQEARNTQLQAELEKSGSERNASDVALVLQENEIRELRKKIANQSEALGQQQAFATKAGDVRELVVARNLHIIDVHDRDSDGKNQRAFGRIFYTEGKSLIFYAYDLADQRRLDAKVDFYVWGERLGVEKPVRSLGVFHSDDVKDGRWVLTFDEPHILAQIDSVFVTVESSKRSIKEPKGRRILFAFLGDKPNHP